MYLNEYQLEAARTAVFPPQHELAYPVLGLIEEIHELMEVPQEDEKRAVDELGDVMWYIAAVARACDLQLQTCYDFGEGKELSHSAAQDIYNWSCTIAGRAKKILRGDANKEAKISEIKVNLGAIMHRLEGMATIYGKSSLQRVCDLNIAKLKDRMERNVLKGDGDNR